ncbi:MAG: TonB-dependent receptor plug domain-containing protein [Verrucomicrobia bacterium]|nr:TonB-dependent receptor plug domain-containing protein [Verrucomicrobiota bacterium]
MNASLRSRRLLCFLACLSALPAATRAQSPASSSAAGIAASTGFIEGRVFSTSTGSALRRARIAIDGTERETTTDDFGAYRLVAPAGPARVTVSYLGLESQSVTVNVTAGASVSRDFDLTAGGVVTLDSFTVVADREMSAQAIALNERRAAPNIKQVVAFDEYGDRGGEDIGEFMRFLPGVGIVDGGQTASSITLRGFPDNNSAMQLDGMDIASARGNSRTQSLLDVSTANISRVEVNKVPTPDMPASGLGGSINIISKSGFEARKPVFNYRFYYITDSYSGLTLDGGPRGPSPELSPSKQLPSYEFSYLLPLSRTFALSFGASKSWRLKPM